MIGSPVPGLPPSMFSGISQRVAEQAAPNYRPPTDLDLPTGGPVLKALPGTDGRSRAKKIHVELYNLTLEEDRAAWGDIQARVWNTTDHTLMYIHHQRYIDQQTAAPMVWLEYAEFELYTPGDHAPEPELVTEPPPATNSSGLPSLEASLKELNDVDPNPS